MTHRGYAVGSSIHHVMLLFRLWLNGHCILRSQFHSTDNLAWRLVCPCFCSCLSRNGSLSMRHLNREHVRAHLLLAHRCRAWPSCRHCLFRSDFYLVINFERKNTHASWLSRQPCIFRAIGQFFSR